MTAPDDIKVKGKVELIVKGTGKSVTGKLVDGKVVLKLPKLSKAWTPTRSRRSTWAARCWPRRNKSVKFELVK